MYYESYARYLGIAPSATGEYPHWMILENSDKNILRMTPYGTLQWCAWLDENIGNGRWRWMQEIVHSVQFLTREDAILFKLAFS